MKEKIYSPVTGRLVNNLTGQKFGKLTAIKIDIDKSKKCHNKGIRELYWFCKCDCGNIKSIRSQDLKSGTTKSCGCLPPANFRDLTGQKFGEWTVIKRAPNRGRNTYWLCRCSCGKTITEVKQQDLVSGISKKCGYCNSVQVKIGDKFGTWTVLKYLGINKFRVKEYLCQCKCGTIKKLQYGQLIRKNYPKCNKCRQREIESVHATVLKQVWKHYRPNVIWEDPSCINPNTGRTLPTDIVDYELKISVEIQSQYHDKNYQAERDKIKKDYWEKLGYKHYQLDIRDYSVLELVQIFFPDIKSIPDWVDKSGKITSKRKWNYKEAQKYLNQGLNSTQVAEKVGTTKAAIDSAIYVKKLERIKKIKNQKIKIREAKIPVVQLNLNGKYINTWESQMEAFRNTNVGSSSISACCKDKLRTAGNFKWVYLKDYKKAV